MKLVGKPYAGKLHVRFDEGVERIRTEIEVFPITAYPFTLLYWPLCLRVNPFSRTTGDGYFESVVLDVEGNRIELLG